VECTSDKLTNLKSETNDTDNGQKKRSENNSGDLLNNDKEQSSDNNIETKLDEVTRNQAIELAHDIILRIFDRCDIQNTPEPHIASEQQFQLPKYDFAFQDMTSSTGTAAQMNTTTPSTTKNSLNFHNNNNCSNNNNSNTKLDNILKRLTGKCGDHRNSKHCFLFSFKLPKFSYITFDCNDFQFNFSHLLSKPARHVITVDNNKSSSYRARKRCPTMMKLQPVKINLQY